MDVGTVVYNVGHSLPSRSEVYELATRLVRFVDEFVQNFFEWAHYYTNRTIPCALYPNMTRGTYNQLDIFTRPGMRPPGRSACTFIALAAVKSFLEDRPFTAEEIDTDLKCGIVAAMRFAGATFAENNGAALSREEAQEAINALPQNVGRLRQLGAADEAAEQFDGLQDLFLNDPELGFHQANGLYGFFEIVTRVPNQKVAAVVTKHQAGSHMLGVTKGNDGSIEEVVFFDSHGALRSQGRCFSLRWTAEEDGNPRRKFEEFINSWYGRNASSLSFTPYVEAQN